MGNIPDLFAGMTAEKWLVMSAEREMRKNLTKGSHQSIRCQDWWTQTDSSHVANVKEELHLHRYKPVVLMNQ